jgi:hypothetical protein
MVTFNYRKELKLSEKTFAEIWNKKLGVRESSGTLRRNVKRGMVLFVAIACLFWAYTFLLGICILVLFLIILFMPRLLPKGLRSMYHEHPFLHYKATYAVDEKGLHVTGKGIQAQCDWSLLSTWQIRGDWLILQPGGIPALYFSRAELKKAGVYDKVMELSKKHGKEFK